MIKLCKIALSGNHFAGSFSVNLVIDLDGGQDLEILEYGAFVNLW